MLDSKTSIEKEKSSEELLKNPPEIEKTSDKKDKKEKTFSGKLCKVHEKDLKGKKLKAIKKLVEKPKFICLKCARVSSEKSNLCEPDKI